MASLRSGGNMIGTFIHGKTVACLGEAAQVANGHPMLDVEENSGTEICIAGPAGR